MDQSIKQSILLASTGVVARVDQSINELFNQPTNHHSISQSLLPRRAGGSTSEPIHPSIKQSSNQSLLPRRAGGSVSGL